MKFTLMKCESKFSIFDFCFAPNDFASDIRHEWVESADWHTINQLAFHTIP